MQLFSLEESLDTHASSSPDAVSTAPFKRRSIIVVPKVWPHKRAATASHGDKLPADRFHRVSSNRNNSCGKAEAGCVAALSALSRYTDVRTYAEPALSIADPAQIGRAAESSLEIQLSKIDLSSPHAIPDSPSGVLEFLIEEAPAAADVEVSSACAHPIASPSPLRPSRSPSYSSLCSSPTTSTAYTPHEPVAACRARGLCRFDHLGRPLVHSAPTSPTSLPPKASMFRPIDSNSGCQWLLPVVPQFDTEFVGIRDDCAGLSIDDVPSFLSSDVHNRAAVEVTMG